MRLDLAVSQKFGLSRRTAREAVRSGKVDVDGTPADEPGREVALGVRLDFRPDRPRRRRVRTRLSVLHEDRDVLIVDKPAGLLTVPTEAREKDTLWARALQYLQLRYGGRPYAGIVHRLDKDTSGAVVFARSRDALHALQDRFRTHAIDREYVALVAGSPPERGIFDADLVREPGLRRSVARPGQTGRSAETHYRTLERFPGAALVSIQPRTGRTHQIRVHFPRPDIPFSATRCTAPERPKTPLLARCSTPGGSGSRIHARASRSRPRRRFPEISTPPSRPSGPEKKAARSSRAALRNAD